jgi:hypothetical protein
MAHTLPVVAKLINEQGYVEYHVEYITGWDGFDLLVQYLVKHWQTEVIESVDWIYSRRWVLRSGKVFISVYYDSQLGNYFVREDGSEDQSLLEEIEADLVKRLSGVEK